MPHIAECCEELSFRYLGKLKYNLIETFDNVECSWPIGITKGID